MGGGAAGLVAGGGRVRLDRLVGRGWNPGRRRLLESNHADVAQLVEHHLAKVGVAGSNPVVRSSFIQDRGILGLGLEGGEGMRNGPSGGEEGPFGARPPPAAPRDLL